jgi:hypothetical protein
MTFKSIENLEKERRFKEQESQDYHFKLDQDANDWHNPLSLAYPRVRTETVPLCIIPQIYVLWPQRMDNNESQHMFFFSQGIEDLVHHTYFDQNPCRPLFDFDGAHR